MIFMTVRALCVSVSNHTLTIETGRYHQQWLPKESRICPYCTHGEERERVCVCTSVRGGALLDPCDIVFPPHEPSHKVRGQELNKHKSGLGPVAVLCRLSRTERNSTSDHSTLCSSQSSLFQSFSHLSWQRPSFQQLI